MKCKPSFINKKYLIGISCHILLYPTYIFLFYDKLIVSLRSYLFPMFLMSNSATAGLTMPTLEASWSIKVLRWHLVQNMNPVYIEIIISQIKVPGGHYNQFKISGLSGRKSYTIIQHFICASHAPAYNQYWKRLSDTREPENNKRAQTSI